MRNFFISLFTPPDFPNDENKTRSAVYGHWIALAFIFIIFLNETVGKIIAWPVVLNVLDLILVLLLIVLFVALRRIKSGRVRLANTMLVVLLWIGVNVAAYLGAGISSSAFIANFIVILAAGLLRGWRTAVALTFFTILTGLGLAYAETNSLLPTSYYDITPYTVIQDVSIIFSIFAFFMFLLISGLDNAVKNAQAGKRQVEAANKELYNSQLHLEENRNELLIINQQLTRRTERINIIAQISKAVASIQQIRELLLSVVHTISQRFGYYHVGIYLPDDQNQFIVLRASNSGTGLNMAQKDYRLRIGEQSVVGFTAHSRQARLVEVVTDKAFFNDPDLPATLSEMALPLNAGDELIGVLDIQTPETNAFVEDDISTLTILADQVAIAIQNAFLFERSQRALREAEIASRQTSTQAWSAYEKGLQVKGFRYDGIKSETLKDATSEATSSNSLAVPVRLRGQILGNLKLKPADASREWNEDELAIIEATSERVALALEGSRLLGEAQRRATRETFLSDVAAKLSTSFQLDSILRDTVEELGQTLKGSIVSFQLVNPLSNAATPSKKQGDQNE